MDGSEDELMGEESKTKNNPQGGGKKMQWTVTNTIYHGSGMLSEGLKSNSTLTALVLERVEWIMKKTKNCINIKKKKNLILA